jgi:hypothetical protein
MGYNLYITRQEHWAENENEDLQIKLEEWLAYVQNDKELTLNKEAYSYTKKDTDEIFYSPGFAEWTGNKNLEGAWFDYSNGSIETKNPEQETITKMKQIAKALNAKLMGDDGETYDLDSDKIIREWEEVKVKRNKPWWKFWK